jgi:hypothetical protein
MRLVATMVDGKDYSTEVVRKSSVLKISMYSDKIHGSAVRDLTWSTKSGLVWHYTWLFNGRATEGALVENEGAFRGTIPTSRVDLALLDSHHCVINPPPPWNINKVEQKKKRKLGHDYTDIDSGDSDIESDIVSDTDSEANDSSKEQKLVDLAKTMKDFYDAPRTARKVNADPSVAGVKQLRDKILQSGPNESAERKLEQLMLHRRLDEAYTAGKLKSCLLAYYLRKMGSTRNVLIDLLLGELVTEVEAASVSNLPVGLQQIPTGMAVLADRGFGYDCLKYANANVHLTPTYIDHDKGQFSESENSADMVTCKLRYSCETVFARISDVSMLRGTIGYSNFKNLQHVHFWAHGRANLCNPFQKPADYDATVACVMQLPL